MLRSWRSDSTEVSTLRMGRDRFRNARPAARLLAFPPDRGPTDRLLRLSPAKSQRVGWLTCHLSLTLLDVFQSAGTMPIDLPGWGIDAAVGGCLKWLCGGPGNCFLWIRPDLAKTLEPRLTGWQAHTVRGFISIAGSKQGLKIESFRNDDKARTYKVSA